MEKNKEDISGFARILKVKAIILTQFTFLESYGFNVSEITENKGFDVYSSNLRIEYRSLHREFSIRYLIQDSKGNFIDSFQASILRLPYDSQIDYIGFEELLKSKVPDYDLQQLELRAYDGTFTDKVNAAVEELVELVRKHALDIIKGEAWDEKLYPKWD